MEAASASSLSAPVTSSSASDPKLHLLKEIRSYEIAIGELSNLPASRNVYEKNGNLFFRTTTQKATSSEQKQLNSAKAQLQKLNSPTTAYQLADLVELGSQQGKRAELSVLVLE